MSLSRQLAAILFTDIKDFSQKREENEPKASVIREKVMHAVNTQVPFHQGKVFMHRYGKMNFTSGSGKHYKK